jgi:hypothetical protein
MKFPGEQRFFCKWKFVSICSQYNKETELFFADGLEGILYANASS